MSLRERQHLGESDFDRQVKIVKSVTKNQRKLLELLSGVDSRGDDIAIDAETIWEKGIRGKILPGMIKKGFVEKLRDLPWYTLTKRGKILINALKLIDKQDAQKRKRIIKGARKLAR